MKTCIATGQKADGSHKVIYVGPDAAKAIDACVNPPPGFVATAAFIRPIPSKARKFEDTKPVAGKGKKTAGQTAEKKDPTDE